ncbi:MAG: hypothetical protein ACXWZG_03765 [Microbacterium sp.]
MTDERHLLIHAFSDDPAVITAALRAARNAAQALPDARVQVVVQGLAVAGLIAGGGFDEDLADTTSRPRVHVAACGNSLRRAELQPAGLAAEVGAVPSAVAHAAHAQWDGAAYVRI